MQTDLEPDGKSTPDSQKRPREPTVNPKETSIKKQKEKRSKNSRQSEERMDVPARKDYQKKKTFSEGFSYVAILENLKSRVNPEELEITIDGIRETRSKDPQCGHYHVF